jgi:multiple sugar transport system ATP-binding protein
MAQRMAVLRRGVLQQVGTPQALYSDPANLFVAEFIGSPAMNLIAGVLEVDDGTTSVVLGDHVRIPLSPERAIRGPATGREVIAGIRPEHLAIANGEFAGPRLRGRVRLVEPLGAETIVHLTLDAPAVVRDELREVAEDVDPMALAELEQQERSRFTLRVFEGFVPRPGELLDLAVPTEHLYLFDPQTGAAIGPGVP